MIDHLLQPDWKEGKAQKLTHTHHYQRMNEKQTEGELRGKSLTEERERYAI